MALLKSKIHRQTQQPRRGDVPPLPHPSWRVSAGGRDMSGAAQLLQPRDFWDRLGL